MRARSVFSQLLEAKVFPNETERIGRSIDEFRNGSPSTMPCAGLDADERRVPAALHGLEARIALPRLVQCFPDLRPAGEPTWKPTISDRSAAHLPVLL